MDFDRFTNTIEDRVVLLDTASDVVRFSFILQDSISYLDLKVCENSRTSSYFGPLCVGCGSRPFMGFPNTEEKCRVSFAPKRRLLYTLHLDLPRGREGTLKSCMPKYRKIWDCCKTPHIAEIIIDFGFQRNILSSLVEEAFGINIPKEKILKWALKIPFYVVPLFFLLRIQTANKFIEGFYPEVTDYNLFRDFLEVFDVSEWMTNYEEPEILEHLLYHRSLFGIRDFACKLEFEFISVCIIYQHYLNIGPILKYISDSAPTFFDYEAYLYKLLAERPSLTEDLIDEAAKSRSRERVWRMTQIISLYDDSRLHDYHEVAPETLRLIWSSIPDACVTLDELKDVFGAALDENELTDIHDFYVKAIDEFHEYVEPRSLQHLCRTVLRRTIQKCDVWIPDGIRQTGLPKLLQAFLNLEKPIHIIFAAKGSISCY